ncbi:aldo/keto reductase [Streptomyces canarius]
MTLQRQAATYKGAVADKVAATATLIKSADDATENDKGPYFKDADGKTVRTLTGLTTDANGLLKLPKLYADDTTGTFLLRINTAGGATLTVELKVAAADTSPSPTPSEPALRHGLGEPERVAPPAPCTKGALPLRRTGRPSSVCNVFSISPERCYGAGPDAVSDECRISSGRLLDTDRVYQLHISDADPARAAELRDACEEFVGEGLVRAYGWSTDDPARAAVFAEGPHCTAVQHALNVLQDAPELVALCERLELASVDRSPLAMGLLAGRRGGALEAGDIRSRPPAWLPGYADDGSGANHWTAIARMFKFRLRERGKRASAPPDVRHRRRQHRRELHVRLQRQLRHVPYRARHIGHVHHRLRDHLPFAWSAPVPIRAVMSVAALPMSICPTAMRYGRPSRESDLVRPVSACLVAV